MIQIEGVVTALSAFHQALPHWVAARTGQITVLKLRFELDIPKIGKRCFDTPAWNGKEGDWFDASGMARVQVGDKIAIRATGRNGKLTRVRRIWLDAPAVERVVTVSLPVDLVGDAVDAYRDAMTRGEWKAARIAAQSAADAIYRQQAKLTAWLTRLEDDAAYIVTQLKGGSDAKNFYVGQRPN